MALKIYDKDNALRMEAACDESSSQQVELHGDNVLSLSFTSYECIRIDVNDYVDFCGERFWAVERYIPEQVSTVEWKYALKLYGIQSLVRRFLVVKLVDGENETEFSLTAPASEHLQLIVDSINSGMGTTDWKRGECVQTENLVIDYSGTYCNDGLSKLAESAGTEFWFDGTTVNLCRCERGESITLAYDNGLISLYRERADNVKFFTRLFPIGSTRNIDPDKYGHTRLQLPDGAKYVDRDIDKYGIIHHYEKEAFSKIYPRRIGTVSSVRVSDAVSEDGTDYKIYWFKDSGLEFNPNTYEIAGLVKHVSFQSGELNGRDFEVNWHPDTEEFEIITQWPYDDGRQVPGDTLIPAAGDKYILWNLRMPDEYYALAEQEYLEAVNKYMDENRKDVSVYKGHTDHVDIDERGLTLVLGQRIRLESIQQFPETGYKLSRIVKITRNVLRPTDMDIEVSDVVSKGKYDTLNDSVSEVRSYVETTAGTLPGIVKSWETTKLTDSNLMSSAKTLLELARRSLSRLNDDTAEGLITFLEGLVSEGLISAKDGLEIGQYVNSITAGKGAGIDSDGNAQVESIEVRSYMKVMELIINRLSAQEGEFNFTESGTIDKVTELEAGTYLLDIRKRWDFDFTAFKENDVVYGSVNSLLEDGGYYTSWFRVLAVDVSANQLTVALYPDNEVPAGRNFAPSARMNICRRGNAIDKNRQSCWYLSSYEGCIMYLEGVTKPILEENNYYLSLGRPKHLDLFNGLPINYDHPYLFARGAIVQDLLRIDFQGNPVYEIVDEGLWKEDGEYIRGYSSLYGKYIQHQVWYKDCCWRCVTDAATMGLPPKWNNTQWVCVSGDGNFTLEITSSKGRFFRFGQEYTTLGFRVRHGSMDISTDASQVEWARESGNAQEDLLWNTEHAASHETVDITPADMPSNWFDEKQVVFRCTVAIRDGETLTQKFTINK